MSPDGSVLATLSSDCSLRLWKIFEKYDESDGENFRNLKRENSEKRFKRYD
jgi:WD40 repeat protein